MTSLKVGDTAPHFEAKDQEGNTIKLSDYSGKKLVLFFYPKASTPGCTAEACNLSDNYQ
ncbi:MAG: redoxin domain-containing protein, partial [Polaribacter sp.]